MRPKGSPEVRVFLVALCVHLLVWLQYRATPFAQTYVSDALSYHLWAERIAEHGLRAEPVFHQSPLFPLLLSWVYEAVSVSARSDWSLLFQCVISSAAIATLVPLGRLWLGSVSAGVVAAALALLHGPVVFYAMKLLPLSLALLTQAAGLVLLAIARRKGSVALAAAAGACWGLACLARTEALLFVLPALLALWCWPGDRPRSASRLRGVAAYVAGLAIVILPVSAHNALRGDTVLLASSAGENLFIGNQRGAQGGYTALDPSAGDIFSQRIMAQRLAEQARGHSLRPSEVSAYWRGRAWEEITADPVSWVRLELTKLGRVLHPGDPTDIYSFALERSIYLPTLWALAVTPWTLFLLGGVGMALALSRAPRQTWPLAALAAIHVLLLLVFFVDARLRLPLLFTLCPFAGYSVVEAVQLWRTGRRRLPLLLAALTSIAMLVGTLATRPTPRDAVRLAAVLSMRQSLDQSLAVLEPWLAAPTPDPLVLDQAGWVLQKQGRFREARDRYLQALERGLTGGRAGQARTRLGQVHEQLGEHAEAQAQHDAVISGDHANAGSYYERALFRLRRNDRGAAEADLREAIRLDGNWALPRETLRLLGDRADRP